MISQLTSWSLFERLHDIFLNFLKINIVFLFKNTLVPIKIKSTWPFSTINVPVESISPALVLTPECDEWLC